MEFAECMNEVKILASGRALLAPTDTTALPTIFVGATIGRPVQAVSWGGAFLKKLLYIEYLCAKINGWKRYLL